MARLQARVVAGLLAAAVLLTVLAGPAAAAKGEGPKESIAGMLGAMSVDFLPDDLENGGVRAEMRWTLETDAGQHLSLDMSDLAMDSWPPNALVGMKVVVTGWNAGTMFLVDSVIPYDRRLLK